jgi:hypothetical protein
LQLFTHIIPLMLIYKLLRTLPDSATCVIQIPTILQSEIPHRFYRAAIHPMV